MTIAELYDNFVINTNIITSSVSNVKIRPPKNSSIWRIISESLCSVLKNTNSLLTMKAKSTDIIHDNIFDICSLNFMLKRINVEMLIRVVNTPKIRYSRTLLYFFIIVIIKGASLF